MSKFKIGDIVRVKNYISSNSGVTFYAGDNAKILTVRFADGEYRYSITYPDFNDNFCWAVAGESELEGEGEAESNTSQVTKDPSSPLITTTKIDIAGTQYVEAGPIIIYKTSISYIYSSRDTRRLLGSDEPITPAIVVFNNGNSVYIKSTVDELQLKLC